MRFSILLTFSASRGKRLLPRELKSTFYCPFFVKSSRIYRNHDQFGSIHSGQSEPAAECVRQPSVSLGTMSVGYLAKSFDYGDAESGVSVARERNLFSILFFCVGFISPISPNGFDLGSGWFSFHVKVIALLIFTCRIRLSIYC